MKIRYIVCVIAALMATACSTSHAAVKPKPTTAPAPAMMSLLASCQALRTDMVNNGGRADLPTLTRIANDSDNARLAADAQSAEADVGSSGWWIDAGLLGHDCLTTSVSIPQAAP